jgi:hypothetical protein
MKDIHYITDAMNATCNGIHYITDAMNAWQSLHHGAVNARQNLKKKKKKQKLEKVWPTTRKRKYLVSE